MTKKRMFSLGMPLLLSILFSLIYYEFTTPLGASIGSDNAIYMTMGTALAKGYAPYTEIFDHKGPLLFVLQAIPQILSGGYSTLAIFVQQVVFLFACLLLLGCIADESGVSATMVQIAYLALIAMNVGGGNLTEEYTNVFTLAGLLMITRTFGIGLPQTGKGLFLRAALLGAMNMLCFLVRANNVLVLCTMTLTIAAWMVFARRYDLLVRCMGGFSVGLAACALPVVVWLAAHGALEQAVYGSILHNMMYAETGSASRLYVLLYESYGHRALLMGALSLLGATTYVRKNPGMALTMVAGAAAAGYAAFISHKFYQHYLLLGAPLAVLGVARVLSFLRTGLKKAYKPVCASLVMLCMLHLVITGSQVNSWREQEYQATKALEPHAKALYAMVPEEDRDSFMAYRVEPKWYVAAQALPCMRFYFLQEILADADPAVMDEIVEEFQSDPPKWLVIYYNREFGPPYDPRVEEIFNTQYEFFGSSGTYQLRRLKEAS